MAGTCQGEEMTQAAHNKTAASEARDLAFETPRTVEVHGRALFAQKTMSEAIHKFHEVEGLNPCLQTLEGHVGEVLAVSWSRFGDRLASAGQDELIRVWEVASGENIARLKGHAAKVYGIAWSPDGKLIASCSRDRTVRLFDISKWDPKGHPDASLCCGVLKGHQLPVFCVAWSTDGKLLASGSGDQTVRIWPSTPNPDTKQYECLVTLRGHTGAVYALDWSTGIRLASGSDDATVRVWEVATGESVPMIHYDPAEEAKKHKEASLKLRCLPKDSTRDVLGGCMNLLDKGHSERIHAVKWRPDGELLASGGGDCKIVLWIFKGESFQARKAFLTPCLTCSRPHPAPWDRRSSSAKGAPCTASRGVSTASMSPRASLASVLKGNTMTAPQKSNS